MGIKSAFVLIWVIVLSSCKSYEINDVVGVYVNCNYEYGGFLPNTPYEVDTLILKDDNTFKSGYYGKGFYQLHNNEIEFRFQTNYDKGSFKVPIKKNLIEGMKIVLFEDLNHHYRRIR